MNRILLFLNIFFAVSTSLRLIRGASTTPEFDVFVLVLNCLAIYVLTARKVK